MQAGLSAVALSQDARDGLDFLVLERQAAHDGGQMKRQGEKVLWIGMSR